MNEWKKDNNDVVALGKLIAKWHGNVWFENQENQNRFYEAFLKFQSEAIEGVEGMTMNERLYFFGLFEEWDCSDDSGQNRIRGKLHAKA